MADLFNVDFQNFLRALTHANVRYMLVGGYSVVLHGYARTTGDLDIWVEPTSENYARLAQAFRLFGLPLFDMTEDNFLGSLGHEVFTFGRPPVAIDVMTTVKGLDFGSAFTHSLLSEVDGLLIRLLSRADLLIAKRAAGRDLNDIEHLGEED